MLTKENGFDLPVPWKFPDAKKYAFTFIALFIALFLIYSNSFHGEWHFDDFFNIIENPNIQIKSFTWDNIKHCIYGISQKRPDRPLSYLSFALNYYFSGSDVFGYHVFNFIVHYLAGIFLFLFIYNTLKAPLIREKYLNIAYPVALLATFLWALHPIHITSITYIVQRMASMAGLFFIMSMYFYLKARTQNKFSHSIILFFLSFISGLAAVLSKENAAMLPVCILIYDLFIIQGLNKYTIKKYLKIALLPLLVILLIGYIYIDFSAILEQYNIRDFTMVQRLLTEPRVILFYLSLLFYPIYSRLTLLYDMDVSRTLLQPWTTIPAILAIIFLIGFAFYIAKKRPLLSFCIIFYFLNHIIEGSIFNLELIYEHRNYLPSMLLFVPVADFIIYVIDYFSYKKAVQLIVASGIIIILAGQGDITYRRNTVFSSEVLLWMDNIEKYPNLSRPYSNLGNVYMIHAQKDKGLSAYEKAMSLDNFSNSQIRAIHVHNLGIYYFLEGKYDLALSHFQSSYKIIPLHFPNVIYMAKIYLLRNEYSLAHRLIKPLLNKYPGNPELNEIFCLILFKENNFQEAELYAKIILKNDLASTFPLPVLAEIARKRGNIRSALLLWKLYQQAYPLNTYANLALIELYFQTNKYELLDQEIAKLYCLKTNQTLFSYIKTMSRDKNLFVYSPDFGKIEKIIEKRKNYF